MMFVSKKDTSKFILPMNSIYKTQNEAILSVKNYEQMIRKKSGYKIIVLAIFQIGLKKLIKHKKNFWKNPTVDFNEYNKVRSYINFLKEPRLYQILVVPSFYDENYKQWSLSVAEFFYVSNNNELINKFMKASKEPVDERATNSATYVVDKLSIVNWTTNDINQNSYKSEDRLMIN